MNKKSIGKTLYISTLLLALVTFIVLRIVVGKMENVTADEVIRFNEGVKFLSLATILSLGVLLREILVTDFVRKIIVLKVVVYLLINVSGIVLFFITDSVALMTVLGYISFGLLIFLLVPTNKFNKNSSEIKNKESK